MVSAQLDVMCKAQLGHMIFPKNEPCAFVDASGGFSVPKKYLLSGTKPKLVRMQQGEHKIRSYHLLLIRISLSPLSVYAPSSCFRECHLPIIVRQL